MGSIKRISAENYVPTENDIVRCRVRTTGIIETKLEIEGRTFSLVDVGGQRSERKKWMHCFEDITAVLFCVGLSEYDQVLFEDCVTNRMQESLKLFKEICQSKWFTYTAMILFLNKSDLFKQKLSQGISIKSAFPSYTGTNEYDSSLKYIQKQFTDITDPFTGQKREIYAFSTCATDKDNVRKVFDAVRSFILNRSLVGNGLM